MNFRLGSSPAGCAHVVDRLRWTAGPFFSKSHCPSHSVPRVIHETSVQSSSGAMASARGGRPRWRTLLRHLTVCALICWICYAILLTRFALRGTVLARTPDAMTGCDAQRSSTPPSALCPSCAEDGPRSARRTHRSCTLPLDQLLELTAGGQYTSTLIVEGGGRRNALHVRSRAT